MLKKSILAAVIGGMGVASAFACTTIIVGPEASIDGSIIVARNDDTSKALRTFSLIDHPRTINKVGTVFKSNVNSYTYELPPVSLAYRALPRVFNTGTKYSSEEVGINESGVAISATETIYNSDKVLAIDPYVTESGINEDSIPSVILPSVTSAREGIMLLGSIIEKQGAAEGFGVAISDKEGTWYLETAGGHRYLAQKIPANKFFVSANQGRFQEVNLDDQANFIASKDLIDFAVKNNLYTPPSTGFWSWFKSSKNNESFNFFKTYIQNGEHDLTYNYPRVESLELLYTGASYQGKDGLFPVFQTPTHPLSVADVAEGLRLHYQGSSYDPYTTQNPKTPYRPISVMRAKFSHITQIRPLLPQDIGYVEYIAIGMPDLSIYIPFYQGITTIPKEYQTAIDDQVDESSVFWKYRKLQALVMQNYPKYAPLVHDKFASFEQETFKKQEIVEKTYLKLYQEDPVQADRLLDQFTQIIITQADQLVTGLTKQIAKEEKLDNLTNADYAKLIDVTEKTYHFEGA